MGVDSRSTKKVPFDFFEQKMNDYRTLMKTIINEEYAVARDSNIDPGSAYVQERIFNRFRMKVSDEELNTLSDNFYAMILQRDDFLERDVDNTISEIKRWNENSDLLEAHYLIIEAKHKPTNMVKTRTVYTTAYFNEKNIDKVLSEKPGDYIPDFSQDIEGIVNSDDIEIRSVSNLTGLYNISRISGERPEISELEYKVYSRIKASYREMIKFVDWFLGLRSEEDYPYDTCGKKVIFPDKNLDGTEGGSRIYIYRDYIRESSKKHGGRFIQKNVNKREKNASENVKKLIEEEYDKNNYMDLMRQCRRVTELLSKKRKMPSETEKEMLLQGIQSKYFSEGERIETWIMTDFMHEIYMGPLIGHSAAYIAKREQDRIAYLNNPALSDARKDEAKKKHKNNDRTGVSKQNAVAAAEPSLAIVAKKSEELFSRIFMRNTITKKIVL
ncbi:MAG: hypothetical protein ACP5N3_01800 [Candidatus Nanoarchaeia archaeon]